MGWADLTTVEKAFVALGGLAVLVGGGIIVHHEMALAKTTGPSGIGTPKGAGAVGGKTQGGGGIPALDASQPCVDTLIRSPAVVSWNLPSGSKLGQVKTYGGATSVNGQGDINISFDGSSAAIGVDWTAPDGSSQHTAIVNNGQIVNLDPAATQQNVLVTGRQFVRVVAPPGATATLDFTGFTGGVNRVVDDLSTQHNDVNLPVAGSCPILSIDGTGAVNVGFTMPNGYIHNKISANGG